MIRQAQAGWSRPSESIIALLLSYAFGCSVDPVDKMKQSWRPLITILRDFASLSQA